MGLFGGGGDNGLFGGFLNQLFGGQTGAERDLTSYARAGYNNPRIQAFLPTQLQSQFSGPVLQNWMQNMGQLQANPGGLAPNISQAIAPWLSNESQSIATNFQGLGQNQASALARGNAPVSIKAAMQSALGLQQEQAQRAARNQAMTQSEALRRQDISSALPLLDALQQFTNSGRMGAIGGLGQTAQIAQQRQAANEAFIASIIQSLAGGKGTAGLMGG